MRFRIGEQSSARTQAVLEEWQVLNFDEGHPQCCSRYINHGVVEANEAAEAELIVAPAHHQVGLSA